MVPICSSTSTYVSIPEISSITGHGNSLRIPACRLGAINASTNAIVNAAKPTSTLNPSASTTRATMPANVAALYGVSSFFSSLAPSESLPPFTA